MKLYKIDQYFEFTLNCQRIDTGAATDADALPTYRVYEENNDTVVDSGNCAKRDDANTVGYYYARGQCTVALGYEVGKSYEVRVAATVNSVAGADVVGRFSMLPASVWDALFASTEVVQGELTGNLRGMLVQLWRRFFKKTTLTASELKTFADNGTTVATTQVVSDDGATQSQGAAT